MSCRKQRVVYDRKGVFFISPLRIFGALFLVGIFIASPFLLNSFAADEDLLLDPTKDATNVSNVGGSSSENDRLKDFMHSKTTQKFTGKPITLQVRDADITDVLRLVGETSGFNIIVGADVKGKVTLSLVDVPWDQALDVLLHTNHLGAERNNNILRIVTLADLTAEKEEERKAMQAAQASAQRVTRVFPINYANLDAISGTLQKFVQAQGTSADSMKAALVQVDARTNSIIVYDSPENIEKIKKLIEILDTQTPQVMIEAKIIEATEGFSKTLSGSLGVTGSSSTSWVASFSGANPIDPLIGSPGVFKDGSAVATASAGSGQIGVSPNISFIPGLSHLNALLNWGETENQLKVVSSPKTVVLNKEKASIVEGTPVLVPGTTIVPGVGVVPANTVQQANVSLNVTPTVTNDGSVLLNLTVTKDVPVPLQGGNGIGNRNINTLVLVESGSTLVIGGIYTMQVTDNSGGFPILRDIPLIGVLFGTRSASTTRSELFIFVTPRILNPKEAGLSA